MTPEQTLLTTSEVAARFRVANGTVRRWVRTGRLTGFYTPTNQLRVDLTEVEALIEGARIERGTVSVA
jgi:excisionase family DNA binding protein